MRTLPTSLTLLALTSLSACSNNGFGSNFEGEVVMKTTRATGPAGTMTIKAKGDDLRIEIPTPDGKVAAAIYSAKQNKMSVLLDAQKMAMDMDMGAPGAPTPNTDSKTSAVEKTGKSETIAGVTCDDYVVKDPSGTRTETCVAKGLPYLDLDALRHGGATSSWSRDMRANKTFPLRSVEYDASGKELSRAEVTSVTKEKLDDALFQVPADYKHVAAPTRH
jgi:hypothetical protein